MGDGAVGGTMTPEQVRAAISSAAKGVQAMVPPAPTAPPAVAPAPATPTPPTPAAPPATPEAAVTPPRGPDGKFIPDPNLAAQREVIKQQKQKMKELEAKVRALESGRPMNAAPQAPVVDPEAAIVASMPKETQEWWNTQGKNLADLRAKKIAEAALEPFRPALEAARALGVQNEQDASFQSDFTDWMGDRMIDGESVDPNAMLVALDEVEKKGWTLGRTRKEHLDATFALLKNAMPKAVTPVVTGAAAAEVMRKEAEAKARAGGIAPGQTYTPPPVNELADFNVKLRAASMAGDQNAVRELMRQRLRGVKAMEVFTGGPAEGA